MYRPKLGRAIVPPAEHPRPQRHLEKHSKRRPLPCAVSTGRFEQKCKGVNQISQRPHLCSYSMPWQPGSLLHSSWHSTRDMVPASSCTPREARRMLPRPLSVLSLGSWRQTVCLPCDFSLPESRLPQVTSGQGCRAGALTPATSTGTWKTPPMPGALERTSATAAPISSVSLSASCTRLALTPAGGLTVATKASISSTCSTTMSEGWTPWPICAAYTSLILASTSSRSAVSLSKALKSQPRSSMVMATLP
mmetsp:Transcript_149924/g.417739  ORF Transcript_149924/g.417739 Transcript_149924/m.417739 type:complete len:250 (+) Transcript_149924:228-977(+)